MQKIVVVIGLFIGLFAIMNGIWVIVTPPFGDEPQGYLIIIIGILIPLVVQYITRWDARREA